MKRVVFLLLFFFSLVPLFAQTPAPGSPLLGDINSDLAVTIVDALMLAQYYVGICDCVSDPVIADVNEDSIIDIIDALLIAQYYVGLINSLPPDEKSIENYTWILQSFGDSNNPVPPLSGTQISLRFNPDEQTVSGEAGCNSYSGPYGIDGNNIFVERIKTTLVMCYDPPGIMQQEDEYIRVLLGAETYMINQNTLTIYCSENRILICR
jgi:heat shock protein HslJ